MPPMYESPLVLNFGNGKKAYALAVGKSIHFLLLPTVNGNLLYDLLRSVVRESLYLQPLVTVPPKLCDFNPSLFKTFFIKTLVENNLYVLADLYGERILPSAYDEIQFNGYFILAQKGNSLEIYNLYLQQMNFPNLKKVYVVGNALEVLCDSGAHYYNVCGNKIDEPEENIDECGNSFMG